MTEKESLCFFGDSPFHLSHPDNQSPERISRRKVNAAYERASEQQVPNSASDGPPRVDLSIVPSYDAVPLLFGVLLIVA